LGLALAVTAVSLGLDFIGFPSPTLFAALLVGIAVALRWPDRLEAPRPVFTGAQAVVGVTLGAYLQSSSLTALADSWLPVALVSLATLGLSLGCGEVLSRVTGLDPATATLGSIAGGASGIVGMSDELGGDDVVRHKLVQRIVEAYDQHAANQASDLRAAKPDHRRRTA
jgi:membrane AbrB-like protein